MEAASEHEEQDVWQEVQTLLLSYVPAGQSVRQASLRGLSFLLLVHASQTFSSLQLAQFSMLHATHAVPVVLGFLLLLQAEHLSVASVFEHILQSTMPSVSSPHDTHLLPLTSSSFANSVLSEAQLSTHVPSALRYLLFPHFVQVTRGVEDPLAEGSSEHLPQLSMPPFAAVPQETQTFLSPLELSVVGKCVPSSLHVDSSRQDVVGVSPVTAFRYRSVVHSVHVAALVPGADNWSGLVHLAQFLIPTCFLSVSTVTPVVSLHKIQESEVSALAGFLK